MRIQNLHYLYTKPNHSCTFIMSYALVLGAVFNFWIWFLFYFTDLRNMPRLKLPIAAQCPLWWCVLPHWLVIGLMRSANSAAESTLIRCTTLGLPQRECGECSSVDCIWMICVMFEFLALMFSLEVKHLYFYKKGFIYILGMSMNSNLITHLFRLQHQVKKHNLIVASYDVVRNDIDFFKWVFNTYVNIGYHVGCVSVSGNSNIFG